MVAVARQILSSSNNSRPDIMANSVLLKTLSCIPFFGILPGYIIEMSLVSNIKVTREASRMIELIEIKNHYIAACVIRNLLSVAYLAMGIAKGIFLNNNLHCLGFAAFALINCCRLYNNVRVIKQLETSGWKPEMYIL